MGHQVPEHGLLELSVRFQQALLGANRIDAERIVREAAKIYSPLEIAERILAPVLKEIGDQWDAGHLALSQVYMSGRICERLVDQLIPPESELRADQPCIGIAVLADYHVLGKRIVSTVLRSAGYNLIDYGSGKNVPDLASSVVADKLDVLLISTLMLPSALRVEELTNQLKHTPTRVFVGGAPFLFDENLWREVGAHGMGRDAADAIRLVQQFEEESS
jgi:trimethylamine corrinoid protein